MNMDMLERVLVVVIILVTGILIVGSTYQRSAAKRQAGELLRSVLTLEQYNQLIFHGHIDIPSPSNPERVYRVPRLPGRVQVREKGELKMLLCLQPVKLIPDADIVVIHKLMIEADEEAYLQKANHLIPLFSDHYRMHW
jgi:hypothetical protein